MQNYQSGGRTRNVVNIADVGGGGTAAYTFTTTSATPTLSTDGFVNHGTQENLHVLVSNTSNTLFKCVVWTYHSFSGLWGKLNIYDGTDASNGAVIIQCNNGVAHHCILQIAGAERIYIQCHSYPTISSGNTTVHLGVNTI